MTFKSRFVVPVLAIAALGSESALAALAYTPSTLSGLLQDQVDTLVKTVGVTGQYRAYQSAAPLGMIVGLDAGIDLTILQVPDDLKQALVTAGAVTNVASAPTLLPVPRLNIHKGLPLNFDLGFSYFGDSSGNSLIGGDVRWALLNGTVTPALGFRAAYTHAKLMFLSTGVFSIDAVVSKNLFVIDPYVGLGMQYVNGSIEIPTGLALQPTVSADSSMVLSHIYVGLPIKMFIFHVTPEYDFNFAGISTYGLKASISF